METSVQNRNGGRMRERDERKGETTGMTKQNSENEKM